MIGVSFARRRGGGNVVMEETFRGETHARACVKALCAIASVEEERFVALDKSELVPQALDLDEYADSAEIRVPLGQAHLGRRNKGRQCLEFREHSDVSDELHTDEKGLR